MTLKQSIKIVKKVTKPQNNVISLTEISESDLREALKTVITKLESLIINEGNARA
jgi:hypothetical protein